MIKLIILFFLLKQLLNADTLLKNVSLQLNWLHQFQFAGYYIAKEKGFYKEVGINLDIKEFDNNLNPVELVNEGKVYFAVGRSSLIIDKINGKDVVALGAIYQVSPLILLVSKENNINNFDDFKNKRIMITSDAANSASIMAMLNANKIKEKDVNIIPHSFNLNDLIDKKTDAMASYLSNEPIILESKNIEYKVFNPKDYGFDFYSDILFSSSKFINSNSKLSHDFYKATLKGWEYAFSNIVETSQIIYEKYNSQNKSVMTLIKEGEILRTLAYVNKEDESGNIYNIPFGYLDDYKIDSIIKVYKVLGLVPANIVLKDFIYEFNHIKERNYKLTFNHVIIILILICILFFFLLRENNLKNKIRKMNETLEERVNEELLKNKSNQQILSQQSKMASMGEMISNIAHQWRQPLTRINLSIQVIEHFSKEKDINRKQIENKIVDIKKNINFMSETIENFTNFFRPDKEKYYFELNNAFEKCFKLLEDELQDIKIISNLDEKKLLILGFENTFIHVLIVIIKNACDNFKLKALENKIIVINSILVNDKIQLSIKDNGGVINPEIVEKIFEPYFTTKFKNEGIGIGLYMAKMLIEESMQGKISVISENQYTKFIILVTGNIHE